MSTFLDGLATVFNTVTTFADNHPFITAIGISAVAGALSPDELDIQKAKYRREDELYRRQNDNRMVGDIRLGGGKTSKDFQEQSGISTSPVGIISSGISPRGRY